ncbi:hypothetical protein [Ottowia thiooxydans]|uniref:hypothetical protein n=1 Tax=Ottowia thiooxydans TaxID=219182 RepID=UPI00041D6483|nr:hypothetical protein [Ottowia thiooxydans]
MTSVKVKNTLAMIFLLHASLAFSQPKLEPDYREATREDYFENYCMVFTMTPKNLIGSLIQKFEKSPYTPEEYFLHSKCQPTGYSWAVKSPMVHYVIEKPESRAEFLNSIRLYYDKKRKQPEIFTEILNVKNTKGETMLDYMETLRQRGTNVHPDLQLPVANMISYICSYGGRYAVYNKSCP